MKYTIEDVTFMAVACRFFEIVGQPGWFYIANVKGDYCDMVHQYENGMCPASNGTIQQTVNYLNRMEDAGMLRFITPMETIERRN